MKKIYLLVLFLSCFRVYSQVVTYYKDADLDTYGNPAISQNSSTGAPVGYVLDNTDCNDSDPNSNPGEIDICNNMDDNCNGWIDEGGTTTFYRDFDNDGFGMASSGTTLACTAPPGYAGNNADCNDGNANIHPGATEIIGDGIDQDCNMMEMCYVDADNDGYRPNSTATVNSSDMDCVDAYEATPSDPVGDCDDANMNINPGRPEMCNGVDDDCDGLIDEGFTTTYYRDFDSDGYGMAASGTTIACSAPTGYVSNNTDCNDGNSAIHPGAVEIIGDGIDQNCNSMEVCYADADNDGYRPNSTATVNSSDLDCNDAFEATTTDPVGDCDDANFNIHPGSFEICNGIDEDCDSFIDEGLTTTYYRDFDSDGYGMASSGTTVACTAPAGYVSNNTDCNDGDPGVHPGATEIIGDGIDQDCNTMEVCYADADNDGYRPNSTATVNSSDLDCFDAFEAVGADPTADCNDNDFNMNPGVVDICNGMDDNCNSWIDEGGTTIFYRDFDSDGYGMAASGTTMACSAPPGYASNNMDCNDADGNIHPAATEICDGANVDENCNGLADDSDASAINTIVFYLDADGDSFGVTSNSITKCDPIGSYSAIIGGDCDDSNPNINPNMLEIVNGIDDNCDGAVDELSTSIVELSTIDKIYLYPNPASEKITVVGITSKTKYQIINYIGAIVQEDWIDAENPTIPIKSLSSGLYQVKLIKDKTKAIKLIKE
ncbi:MAG: MopE-related protein [Bacteroidota bacterium]